MFRYNLDRFIRRYFTQRNEFVEYSGFNCGCCGDWRNVPFKIPAWSAEGSDIDTIGICSNCTLNGTEGVPGKEI